MEHEMSHETASAWIRHLAITHMDPKSEVACALQYASDFMTRETEREHAEQLAARTYALHKHMNEPQSFHLMMLSRPRVPRWLAQHVIANMNDPNVATVRYNTGRWWNVPPCVPTSTVFVDMQPIKSCFAIHPMYGCVESYCIALDEPQQMVYYALGSGLACDPAPLNEVATRRYYGRICVLDDREHHAR